MEPNQNNNYNNPNSWQNFSMPPPFFQNLDPQQLQQYMQGGFNPFAQYSPPYPFSQPAPQGGFSQLAPQPQRGFSQPAPQRGSSQPPQFNDDDDVYVPETQFVQAGDEDDEEEVEEIPPPQMRGKGKYTNRAARLTWTQVDEKALAHAFIGISSDPIVGTDQKGEAFFNRITKVYNKQPGVQQRQKHALNTKWRQMRPRIMKFNGYYSDIKRNKPSRHNEEMLVDNALARYRDVERKTFTHLSAWRLLKEHPRWLLPESMDAGLGPAKRSKTSSSSNLNTPSDARSFYQEWDDEHGDDDDDEEEAVELSRPMGRDRSKRAARSSGTASGPARSSGTTSERIELLTESLHTRFKQSLETTDKINALRFIGTAIDPRLDEEEKAIMKAHKAELKKQFGL